MYFGLCNSPATFQTMMNEIFSDMADIMVIYIDDLMIYTKTNDIDIQEHERLVKKVLKRLEEHDLFAKPENSQRSKKFSWTSQLLPQVH
jgi:hypothetical protein